MAKTKSEKDGFLFDIYSNLGDRFYNLIHHNVRKYSTESEAKLPHILTTISLSEKIIDNEYMKSSNGYGKENVEETLSKYGLVYNGKSDFSLYPVFLGTDTTEMHICSLGMALMVLLDCKDKENVNINNQINRAINSLIITAREGEEVNGVKQVFWPTLININGDAESGTFNQSTVALSALEKYQFLTRRENLTEEQIKNRFELIVSCLTWIVSHEAVEGSTLAWSYGEECYDINDGEKGIKYSILSSTYCYESLSKFRKLFASLPQDDIDKYVTPINPSIIADMEYACKTFESFIFQHRVNSDGGISATPNYAHSSYLHTWMSMMVFYYNQDVTKEKVSWLKNRMKYLCSLSRFRGIKDEDLFEQYKYAYINHKTNSNGTKDDTYEMMKEYFFIVNCTKLIKSEFFGKVYWNNRLLLRSIYTNAFNSLCSREAKISINGTKDCFVISGLNHDKAKHYPIYSLYDAHICYKSVIDFYNSGVNVFFKLNVKVLMWIILLAIAVLSFLISLKVSTPDAIVSLTYSFFTVAISKMYSELEKTLSNKW